MHIRNATYHDAPAIKLLLEALGYKTSISLLISQLENLFGRNDHQVFVYELHKEVVGFISIHYMPQLAFDGELAFISYLSVDETVHDQRIDKALEQYVTLQALKRKCDRIQVHCQDWRTPAHKFYEQQGFQEYPKFYTKRLVYGE
jgi:N-acetylglutamate synthase-like GNAT family acetyltransferase